MVPDALERPSLQFGVAKTGENQSESQKRPQREAEIQDESQDLVHCLPYQKEQGASIPLTGVKNRGERV